MIPSQPTQGKDGETERDRYSKIERKKRKEEGKLEKDKRGKKRKQQFNFSPSSLRPRWFNQ